MRHSLRITCLLFGALLIFHQVTAQDNTCSAIIQEALDATDANCGSIGRNEVCYGNVELSAEPQTGVTGFSFDQPGDVVGVDTVKTLTLASRLQDDNQWGIALMQLQANIPNSLPGQNVTFLLFGDVEIENGVETNVESVTFDVEIQRDLEVFSDPSGEAIGELAAGDTVTATGRDADGVWLQVILDDGSTGWITAESVLTGGEIAHLDIIDRTPMQAFYFRTSFTGTVCAEAPDSGILIQTPEGAQAIEFVANEVNITLGSTAYLQAQPGGDMSISLIEGEATVTAFDTTVVVPAGSRVRVPLDDDGRASGPPSQPEPYDDARLALLPIRILPREITIALEGTPEAPTGGGLPAAGEYQWVNGEATTEGCAAGMVDMMVGTFTATETFRLPGDTFDMRVLLEAVRGSSESPVNSVFSSPAPDTHRLEFSGDTGDGYYQVQVIDVNTIRGELSYSFQGCSLFVPFEITRVGD